MLQIKGLKKSYHETPVLKGIDLEVPAGEIVVIMGPSGCGKSTTIRCVNGLTQPEEGEIYFKGKNVLQLPPPELRKVRREMGFVFQHFHLLDRLTAGENVQFPLIMAGWQEEKAYETAKNLLAKVELQQYFDSYPRDLSGGQQQRIGIARALALNPQLLLLDEPTAALDPILVREVLWVMEDLAKEEQTTMLIVTHELSFALKVADRIVLMDQGEIVEMGKPKEIFLAPQSFIGQKYKELLEYQWEEKYQ